MPIPDFTRAEYSKPEPIEGEVVGVPLRRNASGLLPIAVLYGAGAAIAGALGYAIIGLSGFMVSIVAIGMGWLIAKAMMAATKGIGGQPFQIAAVILTYFSVSLGQTLDIFWYLRPQLAELGRGIAPAVPILLKYLLAGPFLRLSSSAFNGGIGLLILFFGLRTAWQLAAGGDAQYRRMSIFGARR